MAVLFAGYALIMVMRRVLGEPVFSWWDAGVLSFIIGWAFYYQTQPYELHYVTATGSLARLLLNYLYSFVVVC
ncbi:MAG: hypothetical protein ACM3TN_27340 [Alphaproteobacteria bacterium]